MANGACQTCKIRRIRCDERKPTCARCQKSRRLCIETGAAKQAHFSIHVENQYASGKTKRPRGPRSSLTVLSPHFDLQTRALAYYLQYYLHAPSDNVDVSGCLGGCIYQWTVSGKTSSMVDLAVSSMALLVFSRIHKHNQAAAEASSAYSRLLRVARQELTRNTLTIYDESQIDASLLSIILMGRYEGVLCNPGLLKSGKSMNPQSWSHHDGALAILKIWTERNMSANPSSVVKFARRGLIRSLLLRNIPLPNWILNGERFGEHDEELEFDRIYVGIIRLCHASASLLQANDIPVQEADDLTQEAGRLDEALHNLAIPLMGTSPYEHYLLARTKPFPRPYFYHPIIYNYQNPAIASVYAHYFSAKMIVNSVRLRLLNVLCENPQIGFTYEQHRLPCQIELQAAANDLASTIPFCLERFKINRTQPNECEGSVELNNTEDVKPFRAVLVVWPLSVATCLDGFEESQLRWFKSELARLGRITGDGVLECAESDQWMKI